MNIEQLEVGKSYYKFYEHSGTIEYFFVQSKQKYGVVIYSIDFHKLGPSTIKTVPIKTETFGFTSFKDAIELDSKIKPIIIGKIFESKFVELK